MYTLYVCALHVSAAQGHLQATHLFKESTALCTLSIVLLKYSIVIINFGVIGYLFFLFYVLWLLCAPRYNQESGTPNGAQSGCNT
jgi:Ca2+/Na+ antiporter